MPKLQLLHCLRIISRSKAHMKLNSVQLFAIEAEEPTANIVTDRLIIRPTDSTTENKQNST